MKNLKISMVVVIATLLVTARVCIAASGSLDILKPGFDDRPLEEPIKLPFWFTLSFLDIKDDIQEATDDGKKGIVLYFGQKRCPYCKAFLENNFGKRDVVKYTQKNFNVIAIDIHGSKVVTDLEGRVMTEKEYAIDKGTNFTPALIFLDPEGKEALRLIGYYSPYKFRAALEFVADGHYKKESFRTYLARAEQPHRVGVTSMNRREFFARGPKILDRSRFKAQKPLIVFFEQNACHSCDVLHAGPLSHQEVTRQLVGFDAVQLDMWSREPVITPGGKRLRVNEWAEELEIFYAPTLIFYDESGEEIIRIASVVHIFRLKSVLEYVSTKAYQRYANFQAWRRSQKTH